ANSRAGTVTIRLNKPFGELLLGLAMPWASIVCPAGLRHPDSLKTKPSGSGPYVLTSLKRGSQYVFKARPNYNWGPGGWTTKKAGTPQTIIIKIVANESTAANLLLTGSLNAMSLTGPDYARLAATKSLFRTSASAVGAAGIIFSEASNSPT